MVGIGLIILVLMVAVIVTLSFDVGTAFAVVYLPTLIFLTAMPSYKLPALPQIGPPQAAIYGILLAALVMRGLSWQIRFNLLDLVMVMLVASAGVTVTLAEGVIEGMQWSIAGMVLSLGPYFLARSVFSSVKTRELILWSAVSCVLLVCFFALVEARLWPYWFSYLRAYAGLGAIPHVLVFHRYGFMRATTCFQHPIDLGVSSLALMGMISLMATTTSVGLRHPAVLAALGAGVVALLASISFTAAIGLAAALGILGLLVYLQVARKLVVALVLGMIVGGVGFTYQLLKVDVSPLEGGGQRKLVEKSYLSRAFIVQRSWKLASNSGAFGLGRVITRGDLDLDSVDNTYLLHIMRWGYVYLTLWLAIPVVVAWRARKAFARSATLRQMLPLAIAVATILGVMVSMYTVFSGFIYTIIWYLMLGFAGSLMDILLINVPMAKIMPGRLARVRR